MPQGLDLVTIIVTTALLIIVASYIMSKDSVRLIIPQFWDFKWRFLVYVVIFVIAGGDILPYGRFQIATFAGIWVSIYATLFLMHKRVEKKESSRFALGEWRTVVCVIVFILYVSINFQTLFFDSRPSPVDVSPLARLTPAQIEQLNTVIYSLQYHEDVTIFNTSDNARWEATYGILFDSDSVRTSVRIRRYWHEQTAIDSIHFQWNSTHSRLITNDNNTQALLQRTRMSRTYILPQYHRHIVADIRIGDTVINFSERIDRRKLRQNATSDFIHLLYELLTAE